jgi:hypothetical protein
MQCKYCNRDGFNGTKGLASHRKLNKDCYYKWLEEKKNQPIDTRPKVECQICKQKLRNISNTHLKKHNITQQEYKQQYPNSPIFSDGLLEDQKDKRIKTIINKYSKEEIKYLKGIKSANNRLIKYNKEHNTNLTFSEYCKIIHPTISAENLEKLQNGLQSFYSKLKYNGEYSSFLEQRLISTKNTNLKKYGVEFTQQLQSVKDKVKQTKLLKYGTCSHVPKIRQEMYNNIGLYSNNIPNFSVTSQELFNTLNDKLLAIDNKLVIFYATNKGEFQVYQNNFRYVRFLDFYIPKYKKWIEFNEKYHYFPCYKEYDELRMKEIYSAIPDIDLLIIKEEEYLLNRELIIDNSFNWLIKSIDNKQVA